MNDPKQRNDTALFDLVVTGMANPSQIAELKQRIEEDPLSVWSYKESLFEKQFTEEIATAAYLKIEQIRTEVVEQAKEKALLEVQSRLRKARELDLGF